MASADKTTNDEKATPPDAGAPPPVDPSTEPPAQTAPEVVGTGQAPAPVPDQAPEQVVLVPADWTVHAVTFPHGEPTEENGYDNTVTVSRLPRFVVAASEAEGLITSAGVSGFALTKEPVA